MRSYIVDDRERKTFLLDREVLVSEEILRQEMSRIFGRCWIYVGHASASVSSASTIPIATRNFPNREPGA